MKKYTKTYLTAINELTDDNSTFVGCECCGTRATEIHHILNKNRLIEHGVLSRKDDIENIMAICRSCHNKLGDKDKYISFLFTTHYLFMVKKVELDKGFIRKFIKYYE